MATVNFSVPEDVKAAFNKTFKGQNKSAIISDLMRQAVNDANRQKGRERIFKTLTQRRSLRPALSDQEISAARRSGRP